MQLRDPTGDREPDFEDVVWEVARNAIIAGGKTAAEAVEVLKEGWRTQHTRDLEAWDMHLQQLQQEDEQENPRREQTHPPSEQPAESEVPEWVSRPTPSFLDIRPARHIMKRLEKKEYVELWYFTAEGCQEAAAIDRANPDDAYGIVKTDNGTLGLETIGSASRSAVGPSTKSHRRYYVHIFRSESPSGFRPASYIFSQISPYRMLSY